MRLAASRVWAALAQRLAPYAPPSAASVPVVHERPHDPRRPRVCVAAGAAPCLRLLCACPTAPPSESADSPWFIKFKAAGPWFSPKVGADTTPQRVSLDSCLSPLCAPRSVTTTSTLPSAATTTTCRSRRRVTPMVTATAQPLAATAASHPAASIVSLRSPPPACSPQSCSLSPSALTAADAHLRRRLHSLPVWNHSSTAVVNGQTFRDWFIDR